ncbi:MAG: hypothetical protein V1919_00250 [Candidatus Omnitrophota bacterium]
MSKIQFFLKEVRESWTDAKRHLEIYMFLQRYISRRQKLTEIRKII